ncbi:membrane protein [Sporolactobacillus putidus]|uniref:Membrane protein n=2 Tax=Sporolactobacillus putidus TaxID=492735 RepID=A0A917S6N0_9BACL|nr:membrane protein [Sporolactobacillus putidus]
MDLMAKGIVLLCLSVLLNAFGNALTVKAALGSAPWTAAGLNLSDMLGITVGNALIIIGFITLIADDLLRRRWNRMKDVYNFIYVLSFGYVIDGWLFVMQRVTVNGLFLRIVVCVIGVMCIGAALSIYFRVNLVLHPFDDLLKILRDNYLHGDVVLAQRIALAIPLSVGLTMGIVRHHLIGINLGTAISFLFMGYFILLFDKTIHLHLDRKWTFGFHRMDRVHSVKHP